MRRLISFVTVIVALAALAEVSGRATSYPLKVTAHAKLTTGATTVNSVVTITVDRLMEARARTRVLDGLKFNGYQGFMNALRPQPVIGRVATEFKFVDLRYAWESTESDRRRLVLVADKPLFFLSGDPTKARAGYELTVVDLQLDGGTGTMAGAARVKPAPDGGIILDRFAGEPVELTLDAVAR